MSKRVCVVVCIVVLVASMASAFASDKPVSMQIRPASESIRAIRYQSGTLPDKAWKSAPLAVSTLELEGFSSEKDFLFVQQSEDGNTWSGLYAYRYDKQKKSWSVATFPPKGPVRFSIKATDGAGQTIRYQHGEEPGQAWETADNTTALIIEKFDSGKEFLFVQQADAKKEWSDTFAYQYDYLQSRWSLAPTKAEPEKKSNSPSFDVKGLALFPTGRCENFYTYVAGGAIQVNGPLGNVLGHAGLTYRTGPPKSVWVRNQQSVGLFFGMADTLQVSKRVEVIPELGYGVVFHFLEADFDKDGTYSFEFFVDQQVRFSLYLTYALNERYKLFIAPLGVAQFEKNAVGFMYGCQAGLRVSL